MKRYLIKVTYLDGEHAGTSYLLRKGGYVTDERNIEWKSTTYASYNIALRQCKRLFDENELNIQIERRDREYAKKRGRYFRDWNIYNKESYEPYEVEAVGE